MQLINNYNITNVDKKEIWRYLGRTDQKIDSDLDNLLNEVIEETLQLAKPKAVLSFNKLDKSNESLKFDSIDLEGEEIKEFFKDSNSAVLFAVTLGIEVDKRIKTLELIDLTKALMMDACASVLVEEVCNKISSDIYKEAEENNKYITDRFSPGYSDLPLSTQGDITKVLDTPRKIGLSSSESFLLYPRKSVTAFIGIQDTPTQNGDRCKKCLLQGKCKLKICRYNEFRKT